MAELTYDVIVVGGGPAGCAAAGAAHKRELRTLLIERGETPQPGACGGWLGPAALTCCQASEVEACSVGGEFAGLRLQSWDLKHSVEIKDRELRGVVVRPADLSGKLLDAVNAAGIAVQRGLAVTELSLGEKQAALRLSEGTSVVGQIVIIADGATSPTAARAGLIPARQMPRTAAGALAAGAARGARPGVDVILGAGGRGVRLGLIVRGAGQIAVQVLTRDDSAPAVAQLAELLTAAKTAGVVPKDFDAQPQEQPALAGVALDMETHVGKRCLLIGDAGGFVGSFSGEGLFPAMRSGVLAAEVAARAVRALVLQDELATFDATWRADLAEYLRMPNTDLGLLMPMVFNNAQMAKRVARAFLLGQPF